MLQQVGDPRRVDRLVALLHQHLDGKLDHQGDQLEGPRGGAGLHLVQGVLHLLQGQAHKGAVQHGGQQLELGVGKGVRDADQLVFHHAVVRHHHRDKGVFLHHQQVVPLHRHPHPGGGGGKDRVVADLGEHLSRLIQAPVQLLHLQVQRLVDPLGLLDGQLMLAHQLIDVQPVAHRGGHPPGGGVGLLQIPHLGEVGHLIANGGDVQAGLLGHGLGAHRLRRDDVDLHDGPQDPLFPVGQLHTLTSCTSFGWFSTHYL